MHKTEQTEKKDTLIIGYNSSLISFSIVIVSFVSALVRFNSIDFSKHDIFDINFQLWILPLFLASIDSLNTYRKNSGYKLICGLRFFSICTFVLTFFLIFLGFLNQIEVCHLEYNAHIVLDGNLGKLYEYFGFKNLHVTTCIVIYLFSSITQFVASVFKIFIDRGNKKNKSN